MSKYRLVGLESVGVGTVDTTSYTMPSTFTTIYNIVPGSAVLALEIPTKSKYYVEDSEYPDTVISEAGAKMVEFSTRDQAGHLMVLAFGGTNNTTTNVWTAPTAPRGVVEKALQLVSKTFGGVKYTYAIPRAEFGAGADLRFSNKGATEPGVLNFQAEVLVGENTTTNVAPITRTRS